MNNGTTSTSADNVNLFDLNWNETFNSRLEKADDGDEN